MAKGNIILALVLLFQGCFEKTANDAGFLFPEQQFTAQQVQTIADRYGETVDWQKNNMLLYFSQAELETHFQREQDARNKNKEYKIYFEKTKDVHSFRDYLDLLDSLPALKKSKIAEKGGEEGFQKWIEERQKIQWHIYRDENGVLTWARPEDDRGQVTGERLDNKK